MANKESSYIPYFKIRMGKKSLWSLKEGAYLTHGKDPGGEKYEIDPDASNPISKRYYWLLNQFQENHLRHNDIKNGIEMFSPGKLFRFLDEDPAKRFKVDQEAWLAHDYMLGAEFGVEQRQHITRSVYREAARLIFRQYPGATKDQVAAILVDLPKFFNRDDYGQIISLPHTAIDQHIRNLNELSGKPAKVNKVDVVIDLAELVDKM